MRFRPLLCAFLGLVTATAVSGIDYTVGLRCEPEIGVYGPGKTAIDLPHAATASVTVSSGITAVAELGLRADISTRGSGSYRATLAPDRLGLQIRKSGPVAGRSANAGVALSCPLVIEDVARRLGRSTFRRRYVSLFAGMGTRMDPGMCSTSLQWTFGLPGKRRDTVTYEPGVANWTLLVSEAIHPSLVHSFGLRAAVETQETPWPSGTVRVVDVPISLMWIVQAGPEALHGRMVATVTRSRSGIDVTVSLEVEHGGTW